MKFKVELDLPYIEGISTMFIDANTEEEAIDAAEELILSIKHNDIDVLFVGEW